jgi:hypothetical protein
MNYYLEHANQHFPWSKIKPSSPKITSSKVDKYDYIFAIPVGAKMYLWSTQIKERESGNLKQICLLLQKTRHENSFEKVYLTFIEMQPNIILYGTFLRSVERSQVFCVENVLMFADSSQHESTWETKLKIIHQVLSQCKLHQMLLGIPLFAKTLPQLEVSLEKNKLYSVYSYMYCSLTNCKSTIFVCNETKSKSKDICKTTQQAFDQQNVLDMLFGVENKEMISISAQTQAQNTSASNSKPYDVTKNKERIQTLLVRPDVQNDIYHLFSKDKQTGEYTKQEGVALIPNYDTSVMLNLKFRKIKENANLDALEESDDDEEFEDNREDKFVDLTKSFLFQCSFNFKFKKWVPMKCQEN